MKRKVAHKVGHLLWWLAYQIDPKGTPTYLVCSCRMHPEPEDPRSIAREGEW